MATEIELTLTQLAQLALGTPQLTNVNIHVLHSLVNMILKKLNCQNEKVSITGVESRCLQKILDASKGTPLAFNDEKLEEIAIKLERLEDMEGRIKVLGKRLDCHLEDRRVEANLAATTFSIDGFDEYGMPLEDLCSACNPENEIACSLIHNTDFVKKLLRRISTPMVMRIFDLERKIHTLRDEFFKFVERATEEYKKIALIEGCIEEIQTLQKQIDENQSDFLSTMEEVQDMLDAKLDKIHMPALKKYIKDKMERLEDGLRSIQQEKDCPKASGIIMQGIKCVLCGNTSVCADVGVHGTGVLPSMLTKKIQPVRMYCPPVVEYDPQDEVMLGRQVLELALEATVKPKKTVGYPLKCRDTESHYKLFEGIDGHLYRKG